LPSLLLSALLKSTTLHVRRHRKLRRFEALQNDTLILPVEKESPSEKGF
jgi:hypothetical protein